MDGHPQVQRDTDASEVPVSAVATLANARRWALFLAAICVAGTVGYGALTLSLLFVTFIEGKLGFLIMAVVGAGLTATAYVLARHLLRFSSRVAKLAAPGANADLKAALLHQARVWQLVGGLVLVLLIAGLLHQAW